MSEQKKSKALFLLGLCRKAGKSASGEFSCEDAIRKGTAHLVLLSEDASHNTHKKFHNKCTFYSVPIIDTPFSKEALGAAMGQTARSCVAIQKYMRFYLFSGRKTINSFSVSVFIHSCSDRTNQCVCHNFFSYSSQFYILQLATV